jgi:hypothetical protein
VFGKSEPVEMGLATVDLATDECLAPRPLALGKERTGGARPELRWSGEPSRTAGNFALRVTGGAPNQVAVVFEGQSQISMDHLGGVLNAGGPSRRVAVVTLDGNGAATIPLDLSGFTAGTALVHQVTFRDGFASGGIGLTGGLRVDVCE